MIWAAFGIMHSLLRAALTETNREYALDPIKLAFGQTLFGLLILLPFYPMMHWPIHFAFYKGAAIAGTISSIGLLLTLVLAAHKAGRVSSIYMPLEAVGATLLWTVLIMKQPVWSHTDPLTSACTLIAFIVSIVAIILLRPNDVNFRTFVLAAPLGITYAVAGVVTKAVMPMGAFAFPAALSFAAVSFGTMVVVLGLAAFLTSQISRDIVSTARAMEASLLTGLVSVCSYVAFVASVALAPNPGFTSLLAFLLPVWLWCWHLAVGIEDRAHPVAAIFIVIGVILLVTAAW